MSKKQMSYFPNARPYKQECHHEPPYLLDPPYSPEPHFPCAQYFCGPQCYPWYPEPKDDKQDQKEKHDHKEIFLVCGSNPQAAIFEIDDDEVEEDQRFVLDSLRVDTDCEPLVKIEFSSIIFFEAEAEVDYYPSAQPAVNNNETEPQAVAGNETELQSVYWNKELKVDLLFELERKCDGEKEILQTWRYIKEFEIEGAELEIKFSEPFTVTFCDRPCPRKDCCEYRMIVKGKDFEGEFEALRVVTPNLSAIVQCNEDHDKCHCK